jgi:glycosyltransferase involved in cell wall biosynthesis
MNQKISIITPSLNSEKYITGNLESVHLHQSGDFSIEQIIVDGGSTDQTIDIINNFKELYHVDIKVIQSIDKNMYDAINKGLRLIEGDIWACLNTDDRYNSEIFSKVIKIFMRNPKVDVIYGYLDYIDESGKFICTSYFPKFDLQFLLVKGCLNISHPGIFLRKQVIKKVGFFDISYNYASDYDYIIRVASKCNLKMFHRSVTKFRIHSKSISCNNETKKIVKEESERISKKYINELGISDKNLVLKLLLLRLTQIRPNNFRHIMKCLKKRCFSLYYLY